MRQETIELFVAKDGNDDGPGTLEQPLATLEAAQRKVRTLTQTMQADICVTFRGESYELRAPLELQAELDAGRNGHRVFYQPYGYGTDDQEEVTLSGGQEVTDWRLHDEAKDIWVAEIGSLRTRQLFVNGERAARAITDSPEGLTKTTAGYHLEKQYPPEWGNPADVEFVYTGIYPWSEARIGVDAVRSDQHGTTILMKQPVFEWANKLYKSKVATDEPKVGVGAKYGLDRPAGIENGLGFLKKPGTFVFDSTTHNAHKVYYIPRPGEDMQIAKIIVPVLETLVHGKGTENTPLRNITFRGLKFAHAGWWQPSGPNGFLHYHGATYYKGGGLQEIEWAEGSTVTVPGESELTPSALAFEQARAIECIDNQFVHLGAGALEFAAGCSFNTITGNVFTDISATALVIGNTTASLALRQETKSNRIENNRIHHVGVEYHGSSAMLVMDAPDTNISHNHINDVPHSGIVIYGGDAMQGLRITNNLVSRSMSILADGGGINLAIAQGTSWQNAGLVKGNVIQDVLTSYNFGLYTDYGTAWLRVEDNIVWHADTPIAPEVVPPLDHVVFTGNFWDKEPEDYGKIPDTVTIADNMLLEGKEIELAVAKNTNANRIFAGAGIEHKHKLHKMAG